MTLQEWKNKYDPRQKTTENTSDGKSAGNTGKLSLAEWREKYVLPLMRTADNQTAGTKTSAGGGASRLELSDRPTVYNEAAVDKYAYTASEPVSASGGYYTKPEGLWADAEMLSEKAERAAVNVKVLKRQAEDLYAAYQKSRSDVAAKMWQEVSDRYERERTAAARYTDAYNAYLADQQAQYDAWRGTVRTAEQAQSELAAAQLSIDALEKRKAEIGELMVNAGDTSGMEELRNIGAQLENLYDKRDLLIEEYDWARRFAYDDLRFAADFEKLSQYKSTATGEGASYDPIAGRWHSGYSDDRYEIINRTDDENLSGSRQINAVKGLDEITGTGKRELSQLTDDEIAIFNYLYAQDEAKGDRNHTSAYEYIDYITEDLTYRQRQKDSEWWSKYAKEKPVESSAFSVLMAPMKAVSAVGQVGDYLEDGKIDENAGYNKFSHIPADIRVEVSKTVEQKWGEPGSYIYNVGMGIADSAFNAALGGAMGAGLGLTKEGTAKLVSYIMGSQMFADEVIDSKERGLSDGQAFTKGVVAAVIEAWTEKYSVEKLLDVTSLGKNAAGYWLKNVLTEAGEEGASNIANTVADIMISKDKSEWQTAIDAYKAQGLSEEEAFNRALGDQAVSLGLDMLGGAISGGVMATPGVAASGTANVVNKIVEKHGQRGADAAKAQQETATAETVEQTPPAPELDEYGRYENADGETVNPDGTKVTKDGKTILATADDTERARRMKNAKTETARSGIKVDATDEQIAVAERLSEVLGREIRFFREAATEAGVRNGKYDPVTGVISVNVESENPVAQIIAHELTHSVENIEKNDAGDAVAVGEYGSLLGGILSHMEKAGEDLAALRQRKKELYAANGVQLQGDLDIDTEIVAEYVERYLLTDEAAITALTRENRTLGQRILSWIDNVLARMGVESAQERVFLQNARDMYARALKESDQRTTDGEELDADTYEDDGIDPEAFEAERMKWFPDSKYSITVLDDGKIYVNASRNVIKGTTVAEMRKDITNFFNLLLQDKPSLDISTIEGDVLTITKADTADKARDNYKQVNGQPVRLTDEEFAVKLRAEAHIDELAETSKQIGKKPDSKEHLIAKDGFTYRRAYFEDFDGTYYKITLSIGNNGTVATIYNVSTTKEGVPPSAKKIAVVGSKPLGGTPSNDSISQSGPSVNGKFSISQRTGAEKEEVLKNIRGILDRGGSVADLQKYVNGLTGETAQTKKPQGTSTKRRSDAASQILRAAHDAELSVEEYLRENAEMYETEDGWNRDARRALEMEQRGVKYSLSQVRVPTREELESKPDMKVVNVSEPKTRGTFAERRREILRNSEKVIAKPYLNKDTGAMIFLTKGSYTHMFSNAGEIQLNAAERLPEFIENAVLTYAEKPTHGSNYAEGVYTLFAAANDGRSVRPVKLKVKEYAYEGQRLPENIQKYFESLPEGYAASYDTVVLEVEEIEESPTSSAKKRNQEDSFVDPEGLSEISIADLLSLVKGDAAKYIPKRDVKEKNSISAPEDDVLPGQFSLPIDRPDGSIPDDIDADADFTGRPGISEAVQDEVSAYVKEQKQVEKFRKRQEQIRKKKEEQEAKRKRLEEAAKKYHDPKTSKRALKDNLLALFNIQPGSKKKMAEMIYKFADKIVANGQLMEEDVNVLLNVLYSSGVVLEHVDGELKNVGSAVENGFMYVSPDIRGYFGDGWAAFQERAYKAGVHFTTDQADASVETWRDELSGLFPGDFPQDDTPKVFLEKVVQSAENGKVREVALGKRVQELEAAGYVTEQEIIDNLERELRFQLRIFAEKASLETDLRKAQKAANIASAKLEEEREDHQAQRAAERGAHRAHEQGLREKIETTRKEGAEKVREVKRKNEERWQKAINMRREQLKAQRERNKKMELSKRLLNKYKWVRSHARKAPADLRERLEELIAGMDTYAIMPLSEKKLGEVDKVYGEEWRDLPEYMERLVKNDKNFMPTEDLKRKVSSVRAKKIAEMDVDAIGDALQALIQLQTEFYNRKNMLIAGQFEQIDQVYEKVAKEIEDAPVNEKLQGSLREKFFNDDQLTVVNMLRRMAGWKPDSALADMAKQLEDGVRAEQRFLLEAGKPIEAFAKKHKKWLKRADGKGKDGIWYTHTIRPVKEMRVGRAPVYGEPVEIKMTPLMKVYMYLESKNNDNLRHMLGGRTFADPELYAKGKTEAAFAKGATYKLAPETVYELVSNMTAEELELAGILEKYFNEYAKGEINRVSNLLYGYDRAMTSFHAQIFTNENYRMTKVTAFNGTVEDMTALKERQYAKNPSLNIGALDAFERHSRKTAKFVGLAIPMRNWNMLLNFQEKGNSMKDRIGHKWGKDAVPYIKKALERLQSTAEKERTILGAFFDKMYSKSIGAVFALNPSIVLKQRGSLCMALPELGWKNRPTFKQRRNINTDLIFKYTQELAWRGMGNATPETKLLRENPNWAQTNKAVQFAMGDAITWMDQDTASILWPWAENKVRNEHPELEMGTEAEIEAGESAFYKKVAEVFNDAVVNTQSVSDELHQGALRKSRNPIVRTFTQFKSDSAQAYNMLRRYIGEARYLKRTDASKEARRAANIKVGQAVLGILANNFWAAAVSVGVAFLKNNLKKYEDDEGEVTAESIAWQMARDVFEGLAGVVVLGEELAEVFGNAITSDMNYDLEAPGLDVANDLLQMVWENGKGAAEFCGGLADVIENDGDVGRYIEKNANDIAGAVKDLAFAVAKYFGGLPVENLEAYLLGIVSWASPALATAYEDLLDSPEKKDLAGLKGGALQQRIGDILKQRDVELGKESIAMIADLFEDGHKSAVPSAVPSSITVEGETYDLTETQKQIYAETWSNSVSRHLESVISSDQFREADVKTRAFMVRKVYQYGAEFAKNRVVKEYELSKWVLEVTAFRTAKMDMAQYLEVQATKDEIYDRVTDKDLKGVEFAKWVVDQGFTDDQIRVIRDCFGQEPELLYKFVDSGVDADRAYRLVKDIVKLEPAEGKKTVTVLQKSRAVVDALLPEAEEMAALSQIMDESEYAKVEVGSLYDVTPGVYVTFKELLPQYDADGSGGFNQEEVERAIDSIGPRFGFVLPSYGSANAMNTNLTNAQRAVLWQLANKSWKPEANPYSVYVGKRVYAELNQ